MSYTIITCLDTLLVVIDIYFRQLPKRFLREQSSFSAIGQQFDWLKIQNYGHTQTVVDYQYLFVLSYQLALIVIC